MIGDRESREPGAIWRDFWGRERDEGDIRVENRGISLVSELILSIFILRNG